MAARQMKPVFLSASIPDPKRHARYHSTADIMAIRECVRALATAVLPRTRLVFGGHPAITPLIKLVAERLGQTDRIRVFQSAYFEKSFPDENRAFRNVVITAAIPGDREASLREMREQMVASERFSAGVFIGGMEGIVEEFSLFRLRQPGATLLPIASSGAAARIVFDSMPLQARSRLQMLESSRVYGALFEELLGLRAEKGRDRRAPARSTRKKARTKKG